MIRYQEIICKPWYIPPATDLFVLSDRLYCRDNVWAVCSPSCCCFTTKLNRRTRSGVGLPLPTRQWVSSVFCVMNNVLGVPTWGRAITMFLFFVYVNFPFFQSQDFRGRFYDCEDEVWNNCFRQFGCFMMTYLLPSLFNVPWNVLQSVCRQTDF